MPFTPPFTFTRSSARVISLFVAANQVAELPVKPVADDPLSPGQFKTLLHRYKRAVLERHSRRQSDLDTAFFTTHSH